MVYDSSLRVHYNDYFQVYLLWYICYHQSVMSGVDSHVMHAFLDSGFPPLTHPEQFLLNLDLHRWLFLSECLCIHWRTLLHLA